MSAATCSQYENSPNQTQNYIDINNLDDLSRMLVMSNNSLIDCSNYMEYNSLLETFDPNNFGFLRLDQFVDLQTGGLIIDDISGKENTPMGWKSVGPYVYTQVDSSNTDPDIRPTLVYSPDLTKYKAGLSAHIEKEFRGYKIAVDSITSSETTTNTSVPISNISTPQPIIQESPPSVTVELSEKFICDTILTSAIHHNVSEYTQVQVRMPSIPPAAIQHTVKKRSPVVKYNCTNRTISIPQIGQTGISNIPPRIISLEEALAIAKREKHNDMEKVRRKYVARAFGYLATTLHYDMDKKPSKATLLLKARETNTVLVQKYDGKLAYLQELNKRRNLLITQIMQLMLN